MAEGFWFRDTLWAPQTRGWQVCPQQVPAGQEKLGTTADIQKKIWEWLPIILGLVRNGSFFFYHFLPFVHLATTSVVVL